MECHTPIINRNQLLDGSDVVSLKNEVFKFRDESFLLNVSFMHEGLILIFFF